MLAGRYSGAIRVCTIGTGLAYLVPVTYRLYLDSPKMFDSKAFCSIIIEISGEVSRF